MNSGTKELIEEWLYKYYEIEDYISEHIKSKKYGEINYAFTIYDDLLICNLREIKQAITEVLNKLEPEYYNVIVCFYFNKQSNKDILKSIGYDKKTCDQIRFVTIKYIAKVLGLLI